MDQPPHLPASAVTAALDAAVAAATRDAGPDGIALMRILAEAPTEAEARAALDGARAAHIHDAAAAERLGRLRRLWDANPQAWAAVRQTLAGIDHGAPGIDPAIALRRTATAFDRLAVASPEASVALYALGSPTLLAAATDEIVAFMDRLGLLDPTLDALDLGCGIGRFLVALAPRLRHVLGLDIAAGMVAEARRRCAALPNVRVEQGSGRDLDGVAACSVDLVLAVDVFPYLVQAGGGLAAAHVDAFARALRPGGAALVLNYSYRGDLDADRRELAGLAATAGLAVEHVGAGEFTTWDGASTLLRKAG